MRKDLTELRRRADEAEDVYEAACRHVDLGGTMNVETLEKRSPDEYDNFVNAREKYDDAAAGRTLR